MFSEESDPRDPAGAPPPSSIVALLGADTPATLEVSILADRLDAQDPLSRFRDEFFLPTTGRDAGAPDAGSLNASLGSSCVYLCGNSLGLLSKRSKDLVEKELHVWGQDAVEGHFDHPEGKGREWKNVADFLTPYMTNIVGASHAEVITMGTLTANLHLMMSTFYKPVPTRFKVLCEANAFPSDQYAFASQVRMHGYDPKEAIIEVSPRPGEFALREEDILSVIARQGPEIALVLFGGVQYYTGQLFPIETVTHAAQAQGCICGWDLAHAVGNVPLRLHEWGVDFAVWCTYKYLNSGPGGIAGLFVHEKWHEKELPKFAGWWGHDPATRFDMPATFLASGGAQGFQQSNPSVLAIAALLGSLQVFADVPGGMDALRRRSVALTAFLEWRLVQSTFFIPPEDVRAWEHEAARRVGFTIITPPRPEERGAQLSLLFYPLSLAAELAFAGLRKREVIGDERRPDVIRLAPAPLYNSFADCLRAAYAVEETMAEVSAVLQKIGREAVPS
ncbi:hypothetical protein BOTBODRAFT_155174 [Botryobasidium botryosum FD-172 SS1]|uniref:Kynureninase n=1 Tax=Botryobasidium botryosum (strain FD-172 SS1) TaxID=930990 RepID=A0A067MR86_BOTB1|nr:hypothetical protein BOTBODRAFT_155174 [Botryobasidium botryosum FD-172 SS1]